MSHLVKRVLVKEGRAVYSYRQIMAIGDGFVVLFDFDRENGNVPGWKLSTTQIQDGDAWAGMTADKIVQWKESTCSYHIQPTDQDLKWLAQKLPTLGYEIEVTK